MKPAMNISAAITHALVPIFLAITMMTGMANGAQMCLLNEAFSCGASKIRVCAAPWGGSNSPETKCLKISKLRSHNKFMSGGQLFVILACGACPTPPPTPSPTPSPTLAPTQAPTLAPTSGPTAAPTQAPTMEPTITPTAAPTPEPTLKPTRDPTPRPTLSPTQMPTSTPTPAPTLGPTYSPSDEPSSSLDPSSVPSVVPSFSIGPSTVPSNTPSISINPSTQPSAEPSGSISPSSEPSAAPSRSMNPTVQPSAEPSSSIRPSSGPPASSSPSVSPSFNPTYICGPGLEVNPEQPVVDITNPVSFFGIDEPDAWQGYRVNVTLDSYTIHMRFRLSQKRDAKEGTLIDFRRGSLDAHHDDMEDDALKIYGALLAGDHMLCLFDCNRFNIRTNCWVDLKVTRAHTGEMKFSINDGINAVQSSVFGNGERKFQLVGNERFFKYRHAGPYDSNGEIAFIKIYKGVVEDLTAMTTPSLTPSFQPSSVPSVSPSQVPSGSIGPSSSPSQAPSSKPSRFPTLVPSSLSSPKPSRFPTSAPSSLPLLFVPSASDSPSRAPSSNPTHLCGPTLNVNPDEPILDITTPVSFSGIADRRAWQGYRVNVTLDSYTIHLRFRLSQARDRNGGTLIHFSEEDPEFFLHTRHKDKELMSQEDDALELYYPNQNALFDGNRFDLRTNCWVDLKITRNHTNSGEMIFLINDGIHAAQSSVFDDFENYFTLRGKTRFFDSPAGDDSGYNVDGEIDFIKIYPDVVEDLAAVVII